MTSCPPPKMHPSIEATLCDYLRNGAVERIQAERLLPHEVYADFQSRYHVDDWGIQPKLFVDFMLEVSRAQRCSRCGTRAFPYFIAGDPVCIRCNEDNPCPT